MLRFYDPKHATTPVIQRDQLRPARPMPANVVAQQVVRGVLARFPLRPTSSNVDRPTIISFQDGTPVLKNQKERAS